MSPTDPSIYSAVQGGHLTDVEVQQYFQEGKDDRWLNISWPAPTFPCVEQDQNRYRLTVDPEDGTILFVDEESDIRQAIDYRNLLVLIKRSLRIQSVGKTKVEQAAAWEVELDCTCPKGWSSVCVPHGAQAPVPGVSH